MDWASRGRPHDARTDALVKTLMLGKIEGRRRREGHSNLIEDEMVDGITDLMDMNFSKLWELVIDR